MAPTKKKNSRRAADITNTNTNDVTTRRSSRTAFSDVSNQKPPAVEVVAANNDNKKKNAGSSSGKRPPPAQQQHRRRSARFLAQEEAAAKTKQEEEEAAAAGGDREQTTAIVVDAAKSKKKAVAAAVAAAGGGAKKGGPTANKKRAAASSKPPPAPRGRNVAKKAASSKQGATNKRGKSQSARNKNSKRSRRSSAATRSSLEVASSLPNDDDDDEEEEEPPTKVQRKTRSQRSRAALQTPHRHDKPGVQHSHGLNVVSLSSSSSPFDSEKYTAEVADHDVVHLGEVLEVPEYVTDIYQRLFHAETKFMPQPYIKKRGGIPFIMRYHLIDRLVDVARKFQMDNETLHLCVNIVDRYCGIKKVKRNTFYLVGVTALLIASKYEEIYAIPVEHCVAVCNEQYDWQDFLDMEYEILQALEYKISGPTAFPFLQRFLHLTNATKKMSFAASYFLERALHLDQFMSFRPSLVAAAAVCLAINHPDIRRLDRRRSKPTKGIPPLLLEYTGFETSNILQAAKLIEDEVAEHGVWVDDDGWPLNASVKKYSHQRCHRVSRLPNPPRVKHLDGSTSSKKTKNNNNNKKK